MGSGLAKVKPLFIVCLVKSKEICYTYDSEGKVIQRVDTDLVTDTETEEVFTYDLAGNITSDANIYDESNALVEQSGHEIEYDEEGNMRYVYVDGEKLEFTYDSHNRLIRAGETEYIYNAEDVRIKKTNSESTTEYIYDTNARLSRLLVKVTDGVVTKYVYGLGLIGQETNDSYSTYHFDYRGSTVAVTDSDGTVTDTFAYDTYGKITSSTGETDVIFRYNGRDGVITEVNGLYYMRTRYYSPVIKRFINADIISGDISNAITLNRFAYANGNPVSFVDPFGLSPERGPTVLEAAYMVDYVYDLFDYTYLGDNDKMPDLFGGWKLHGEPSYYPGLYICVFHRNIDGVDEYVVVNKGTALNFKSLMGIHNTVRDWTENILQPFGASWAMETSILFAENFVQDHPDAHITFVGHSKGGAEAAANAVATNSNAILFNPATVNFTVYGLNSNNYTSEMAACVVSGEILETIFASISVPIDEKYSIDAPFYYRTALDKHSINAIIDV